MAASGLVDWDAMTTIIFEEFPAAATLAVFAAVCMIPLCVNFIKRAGN